MKKLFSIIMSVLMIACFMPSMAFATGGTTCSDSNCNHEAAIGTTHYATLKDALAGETGGSSSTAATEIKLLKDVNETTTSAGNYQIVGKSIKIDLNNHSISFPKDYYFIVYNGKLELTGTGTVKESEPTVAPVVVVSDQNPRSRGFSCVVVDENVTLEGYNGLAVNYLPKSGENFGPHAYGVEVTVKGKLVSNYTKSGNPGLNGCGITIDGDIVDKTVSGKGDLPAITLDGATITSTGCGIYAAGYAEWTLKGNTTIAAADPISVKSGKFTIESGTYTANGPLWGSYTEHVARKNNSVAEYSSANSGSEPTGAALSITTSDGYAGEVNIDITGGTFSSQKNSAVYEGIGKKTAVVEGDAKETLQDTAGASQSGLSALNISGGTFTSASSKGAINITAKTDKKVVSAGTFSTDPTNYVKDAKCITQNAEKTTWTVADHNLTATPAKAATCTETGNDAYWKCGVCNKVFSDAECTKETTVDEQSTEVVSHSLTKIEAKAATCTENGNKEYWTCSSCKKLFSNDQGTTETNKEAVTTQKTTTHTLKENSEVAPTTSAYGVKAYWTCTVCKKNFSDTEGTTEIENIDKWKSDPKGGQIAKLVYSGGSSSSSATTDNVTNKAEDKTTETAATTTATVKNTTTTASDGTKTVAATVDTTTATKIVEKAVENKSEEVVVNAATKTTVSETAAGTKTEVAIPAAAVSQVAEKTEAAVTIKSDAAEVTLDKEAIAAVAKAAGTTGEVKLVVDTVAQEEGKVEVDLKLVTANGNVSEFKGGKVSVTIKLNAKLATKDVKCLYIDDAKAYHKVDGQKNADGTFTFKTGHFSSYAVVEAEEADKLIAEQDTKVAGLTKDLTLKARSEKTAKGNIKVTLTVDADDIKAIEDLGYTVKYKFYRSTKKASSYKAKLEGTGKTYTNTTGKKGTKYYYKARVMVYDAQGALVTKTELKQCKYACRTR